MVKVKALLTRIVEETQRYQTVHVLQVPLLISEILASSTK